MQVLGVTILIIVMVAAPSLFLIGALQVSERQGQYFGRKSLLASLLLSTASIAAWILGVFLAALHGPPSSSAPAYLLGFGLALHVVMAIAAYGAARSLQGSMELRGVGDIVKQALKR